MRGLRKTSPAFAGTYSPQPREVGYVVSSWRGVSGRDPLPPPPGFRRGSGLAPTRESMRAHCTCDACMVHRSPDLEMRAWCMGRLEARELEVLEELGAWGESERVKGKGGAAPCSPGLPSRGSIAWGLEVLARGARLLELEALVRAGSRGRGCRAMVPPAAHAPRGRAFRGEGAPVGRG